MSTRPVRIWCGDRLVGVNTATSLKAALKDYFKEVLGPAGWRDPIYQGNTVTVSDDFQTKIYTAREAT